jgi:hypothetical protein
MVVDGAAYRWVVSPDDGYLVLVAELADDPGQRLEVIFEYHDVYAPVGSSARGILGQRGSVRPAVVRAAIQVALSRGWQPARRGLGEFRLHDAEQLIPVTDEEAESQVRLHKNPL